MRNHVHEQIITGNGAQQSRAWLTIQRDERHQTAFTQERAESLRLLIAHAKFASFFFHAGAIECQHSFHVSSADIRAPKEMKRQTRCFTLTTSGVVPNFFTGLA